jgi:O-antigen/teichoic acid export membrane protein
MARGSVVALLGGLVGSVVGWLGQLLLARLLGPGGFGSYAIGVAMVSIAAQISTLGLSSASIYFVARYARDEAAKARDVLMQSVGASLFTGLVVGSVLFLLSPLAAKHFFHRPDLAPMLRMFALSVGFVASFRVARAATTVSYKLSYRVYLDLISTGSFLLIFVALYLLGGRLGGASVAYLVSTVLGCGASVYFLIRLFPGLFAASSRPSLMLREIFAYSMPAFGASLLWAPQGWMNRLLLGYFRPPAEVGLYQAAAQSVSPLYVGTFAVGSIAAPMIASLYNRGEHARLEEAFRVSSKWILYSTLIVFTAIAAGPRDLLKMFFGAKYLNGTTPLMILSIGALIDNADGTARSMLLLTGNQKMLLRIAAMSLILQFGLDLYLIPRYGIAGAAVAEVAASILLSASMLVAVKRVLGMSPYDRRYLKGLLAWGVTGAGLYLIRPPGMLAIRLALRALIACLVFAAVILALGLDSEDRQVALAAFRRSLRQYRGE